MIRKTLVAAAALAILAGALLFATFAGARGGDGNHDGLPDRWERKHGLSLKLNQGRRDQDRDGLNNRGEYRAGFDPRDDDSDDDGTEDGDENAGTIASFAGGVLTLSLAKGGTLTARITHDTERECETATTARDDDEENGDHDDGDEGDGEHGDGDLCPSSALTPGRAVEEAELKTRGGEAVWEEIELAD